MIPAASPLKAPAPPATMSDMSDLDGEWDARWLRVLPKLTRQGPDLQGWHKQVDKIRGQETLRPRFPGILRVRARGLSHDWIY